MRKKIIRAVSAEMAAIFILSALLVAAVGRLTISAVRVSAIDRYPNLSVFQKAEIVTPTAKTVYFTFDDGPSVNTAKVLDVLAENDVHATFFVTAQNSDEPYAAAALERMLAEGHTIGLHTYTHDFHAIYRSADSYLADVDKLAGYIRETVGISPNILRFPGGSATINASRDTIHGVIRELDKRGYLYFDWDVVSGDDTATIHEAEHLAERIVNGCKDRQSTVVLLHDSPAPVTTPKAVEIAISRLKEAGFSFAALDETVLPTHIKTTRDK